MPSKNKSPKAAPKTNAPRAATGRRRLGRGIENYPQSDAPPPARIDGAEIVLRVAGMFPRDMDLREATELAKGLAWAYGAASMFLAIQGGISGDQVDALAQVVRDACEDGQRQVLEAALKDAQRKEQAA